MRFARLAAALTVLVSLAVPAAAAPKQGIDFHDARYCEILVLTGEVPDAKVTVFDTIGLNQCPAAKWEAIDAGTLASEIGAKAVILNGPRHFLMDSATGDPGPVRSFDGLKMRQVATIAIHAADELVPRTYSERTITRHNTWTWDAGRRVYELLSPNGSAYVMQSYAQIKDPSLSIRRLRSLGESLALPAGWRYRSRVLKHDFTLHGRGAATIVQDDLANTYQVESRKTDFAPHDVDLTGATHTVGSPAPQTLEDQGTVSGAPFGDGAIDILVKFGENSTATGAFTIDTARGSVFGTVAMTYTTAGNEIDFTGTADLTGGTGKFRGIRGEDLAAHDHNTLDGQHGVISLKGPAAY